MPRPRPKSCVFDFFKESEGGQHYICTCEVTDTEGNIMRCKQTIKIPTVFI